MSPPYSGVRLSPTTYEGPGGSLSISKFAIESIPFLVAFFFRRSLSCRRCCCERCGTWSEYFFDQTRPVFGRAALLEASTSRQRESLPLLSAPVGALCWPYPTPPLVFDVHFFLGCCHSFSSRLHQPSAVRPNPCYFLPRPFLGIFTIATLALGFSNSVRGRPSVEVWLMARRPSDLCDWPVYILYI